MKFFKWLFTILFFLIIALVIGGYFFLKNFDLNKYKSYAEKVVYEQTGRKLTIAGDASIGLSLIPTIIINDVSYANPEWAKNPQMATVGSVEVRFSLIPLLSKQVIIDRVLLNNAKIFLETSATGENSWDIKLKTAEKTPAVSSSGWLIKTAHAESADDFSSMLKEFVAHEVIIENGSVYYYNHKDKSKTQLDINNIKLGTEGINSPITAEWDVVFNTMNFSGKGELGSLAALLSGQGDFPLKVDMKALGIKALINAKIHDMMGDKLKASFDYNIYNSAGNLNAPETTLIGTGEADLKNIVLNISKLDIVNNILKGKVKADISGAKPFIDANITGSIFDLGVFNRNKSTAFNFEFIKSAQATTLVPNDKIPYELLQTANAKAKLQLEKLIVNPELALNNLNLNATLSNGLLNVPTLKFDVAGGKADVTASVNAKQKNITLKGKTENILLTDMIQQLKPSSADTFGFISGGNTQTYFDLKGTGLTYRQVADSLSGQILAVVEKAKFQTGKVKFITSDFITQLLDVINVKKSSDKIAELKCAVVRADLQNGILSFPKGIAIDTNKIDIVSSGTISLPKDKINLSLNVYREGVAEVSITQALASLVKISGNLQSPRVSINQENTIKTLAGVALSGGAMAGAQMLLDKDIEPCYTAMQGTLFQDRFTKPTGVKNAAQKTYQGASTAVDNSINMVKDSAKGIKNVAQDIVKGILQKKKEGTQQQ